MHKHPDPLHFMSISATGESHTIWKYNAINHLLLEHAKPDGTPDELVFGSPVMRPEKDCNQTRP